jgi:pimeloyl-ACP methyl ester carboxylesterase
VTLSHWANPTVRAGYEQAYASALALWPIPREALYVPTPVGPTHVLVSGADDGPPLVLIHAASLSATQWYPQAAELGSTHRLYAVDIMGDIGLSRQTGQIHTRAEAADWLAAVLDGLGLERAVFIGSSFGGFHSANLAVQNPDRVDGLVLLAPAATLLPFKPLVRLAIRAGSLLPMPFTVEPGLRGMMDGDLPDDRIVRQMKAGVAGFRYDRRGIFPTSIPDAELAAIRCPTLVMLGSRERIYDPRAAIAQARRLIPGVETDLVAGAGHLPGLQWPGTVNTRIRTFLGAWRATAPESVATVPGSVLAASPTT